LFAQLLAPFELLCGCRILPIEDIQLIDLLFDLDSEIDLPARIATDARNNLTPFLIDELKLAGESLHELSPLVFTVFAHKLVDGLGRLLDFQATRDRLLDERHDILGLAPGLIIDIERRTSPDDADRDFRRLALNARQRRRTHNII